LFASTASKPSFSRNIASTFSGASPQAHGELRDDDPQ
jgi:hypothetical protein